MSKRKDSSTVWVNGHAFHGLEVVLYPQPDAAWWVSVSGPEVDVLPVAFVGDMLSAITEQRSPDVVPVTVEQGGVYRKVLVRAARMQTCMGNGRRSHARLEFIGHDPVRTVRRPHA